MHAQAAGARAVAAGGPRFEGRLCCVASGRTEHGSHIGKHLKRETTRNQKLGTLCQIIVSQGAGGKSILPTAWLCLTTSRLWISSHPYRSGGSDAPLCDSTRLLSKRMFTFRPAFPRRKGRRHDAQGNLFFGNVAREHVLRRRKYCFGH